MNMIRIALLAGALTVPALAIAASSEAPQPSVQGTLIDSSGASHGEATFSAIGGTTRVMVSASGLTPGKHGMHLHTTGKCDTPDFTSAGVHWNPDHKQHGHANPAGPHQGDLPQLTVGADGTGKTQFVINARLTDITDMDGAALIIHANADDETTDPSGNSGARQLCAALGVPAAASAAPAQADHMGHMDHMAH